MNKKILVVICLMAMTMTFSGCDLLGGDKNEGGAKNENSAGQKGDNKISENDNDNESAGKSGNYFETMEDLMARGKSMKCTYTQKVGDSGRANGVVYVADKKARTEITIKEGSNPAGKMYAIVDNEWTYSWTEGSSKGYKMTVEAAELDAEMKGEVSDLSKDIKFSCKSWKKDSSKFKAPSNIVFEDLSEMMEGLGDFEIPSQEETDKMICDLCKNAPVSEREECLDGVICDWQIYTHLLN